MTNLSLYFVNFNIQGHKVITLSGILIETNFGEP